MLNCRQGKIKKKKVSLLQKFQNLSMELCSVDFNEKTEFLAFHQYVFLNFFSFHNPEVLVFHGIGNAE